MQPYVTLLHNKPCAAGVGALPGRETAAWTEHDEGEASADWRGRRMGMGLEVGVCRRTSVGRLLAVLVPPGVSEYPGGSAQLLRPELASPSILGMYVGWRKWVIQLRTGRMFDDSRR